MEFAFNDWNGKKRKTESFELNNLDKHLIDPTPRLTPWVFNCFYRGLAAVGVSQAASRKEMSENKGFASSRSFSGTHLGDPPEARRWQARVPIRVTPKGVATGASGASRSVLLAHRVSEANDHLSILDYKVYTSTKWQFLARACAHTLMGAEFVGCLSDKIKKVIDKIIRK